MARIPSKIPALQGSTKSLGKTAQPALARLKGLHFWQFIYITHLSGNTGRLPYSESGNKVRQQANQGAERNIIWEKDAT